MIPLALAGIGGFALAALTQPGASSTPAPRRAVIGAPRPALMAPRAPYRATLLERDPNLALTAALAVNAPVLLTLGEHERLASRLEEIGYGGEADAVRRAARQHWKWAASSDPGAAAWKDPSPGRFAPEVPDVSAWAVVTPRGAPNLSTPNFSGARRR